MGGDSGSQRPAGGGGPLGFLVPMGAIMLIFYLLLIRPQAKQPEGAREDARRARQKGDRVVTAGGLHGVVVGRREGRAHRRDRRAQGREACASRSTARRVERRLEKRQGREERREGGLVSLAHAHPRGGRRCWSGSAGSRWARSSPTRSARPPGGCPTAAIRLGLDLRGGVHIVIGARPRGRRRSTSSSVIAGRPRARARAREGDGRRASSRARRSCARARRRRATRPPSASCSRTTSVLTRREDGGRPRAHAHARLDPRGARARHAPGARGAPAPHRRPRRRASRSRSSRARARTASWSQIPGVAACPTSSSRPASSSSRSCRTTAPRREELLRAKHPDGLPAGTEIALEKDRKTERVIAAYLVPDAGRHHRRLPRRRPGAVRQPRRTSGR